MFDVSFLYCSLETNLQQQKKLLKSIKPQPVMFNFPYLSDLDLQTANVSNSHLFRQVPEPPSQCPAAPWHPRHGSTQQ